VELKRRRRTGGREGGREEDGRKEGEYNVVLVDSHSEGDGRNDHSNASLWRRGKRREAKGEEQHGRSQLMRKRRGKRRRKRKRRNSYQRGCGEDREKKRTASHAWWTELRSSIVISA